MKRIFAKGLLLVLLCSLLLSACGKPTLDEMLSKDPSALECLRNNRGSVSCSDYTVYCTGGGIDDSINATRYSSGLIITTDRFVNFKYVVLDNRTDWKYIFENLDDIPIWVSRN